VEEAGGDCLEQLGDVRGTTGVSTGVTIGLWGRLRRPRRSLVVTLTQTLTPVCGVCSSKGLTVGPRSWWGGGLFLCRRSLLLASRNGLQTKGSQESNPLGGGLLRVHCCLGREELIESTEVGVSTLPGLVLLRVLLACVAHLPLSFLSFAQLTSSWVFG